VQNEGFTFMGVVPYTQISADVSVLLSTLTQLVAWAYHGGCPRSQASADVCMLLSTQTQLLA